MSTLSLAKHEVQWNVKLTQSASVSHFTSEVHQVQFDFFKTLHNAISTRVVSETLLPKEEISRQLGTFLVAWPLLQHQKHRSTSQYMTMKLIDWLRCLPWLHFSLTSYWCQMKNAAG